jgi:hypothetical protein
MIDNELTYLFGIYTTKNYIEIIYAYRVDIRQISSAVPRL